MKLKTLLKSSSQKPIHGILILVLLFILCTSCIFSREKMYEGQFSSAFEVSVFYPCGMEERSEYIEGFGFQDHGYWLTSNLDSGFNDQFHSFDALRDQTGTVNLYVKFIGKTSPTKKHGYGHLGMYSNQVNVIELVDMKPWSEDLCEFTP